jgi:hypothetical protein
MTTIDAPNPNINLHPFQNRIVVEWSIPESKTQTVSSFISPDVTYRRNNDINRKLEDVNNAWEKEYEKYKHYIKGNEDIFFSGVKSINRTIAKINYKDFDIELTPSNTIVYDLLLPNNQMLVIRKSFEKYDDKAENDVVFSIFENKTHILSGIKDLNELVSLTNNYIEM